LQAGLVRPHAVKVFHVSRYNLTIKDRCNNLGCWPLCLLVPNGAVCSCPDHTSFLTNSNKTCDAPQEIVEMQPLTDSCNCRNGGLCQTSNDALVCVCPEGFSGSECQYHSVLTDKPSVIVGVGITCVTVIMLLAVLIILYLRNFRRKAVGSSARTGFSSILFSEQGQQDEPNVSFSTRDTSTPQVVESDAAGFVNQLYGASGSSGGGDGLSFTELSLKADQQQTEPAGFKPTSADSDKDTQQLVERDED
jgi:hypothetical protein